MAAPKGTESALAWFFAGLPWPLRGRGVVPDLTTAINYRDCIAINYRGHSQQQEPLLDGLRGTVREPSLCQGTLPEGGKIVGNCSVAVRTP